MYMYQMCTVFIYNILVFCFHFCSKIKPLIVNKLTSIPGTWSNFITQCHQSYDFCPKHSE